MPNITVVLSEESVIRVSVYEKIREVMFSLQTNYRDCVGGDHCHVC